MLHAQHGTPPSEDAIQRWAPHTPNCSMRLNELAAAIALPQLASLEARNDAWRAIYDRLAAGVRGLPNLRVPHTLNGVVHAPTSFQFIVDLPPEGIEARLAVCAERGVPIKWFGRAFATGFTSVHRHWGYVEARALPKGDAVLAGLCDVRLPSDLTVEEVDSIVAVIRLAFNH
jgi:dTDP-4-amino-4,6-dideoxygalactose transaminase